MFAMRSSRSRTPDRNSKLSSPSATLETRVAELAASFAVLQLDAIVLKENRGGSRLYIYSTNETEGIPAQLGVTINSVGVTQTRGLSEVYSGFINSNHAKELDCSTTFLNSLDALSENLGPVRFNLPFRDKTKREVTEIAKRLSVPIGRTFSCQVYSAALVSRPRYILADVIAT